MPRWVVNIRKYREERRIGLCRLINVNVSKTSCFGLIYLVTVAVMLHQTADCQLIASVSHFSPTLLYCRIVLSAAADVGLLLSFCGNTVLWSVFVCCFLTSWCLSWGHSGTRRPGRACPYNRCFVEWSSQPHLQSYCPLPGTVFYSNVKDPHRSTSQSHLQATSSRFSYVSRVWNPSSHWTPFCPP